ncbi:MAG: DUF2333 family protein [Gammaproteobacteria bacterium]|nr:DUF2333 family protein [Gammaproteobacteria bacterium]
MKERLKSLFARSKETLETRTTPPAFTRLAFYLAVAIGLLVLPVGLYFNQTPDRFSVASTEATLIDQNIRPVVGTRSVATLSRLTASLLDKPGGYLSNDVLPPSVFMDNVPRWEFGVLVQCRDFARALRNTMSRSQSQSTEDQDLVTAENQLYFDSQSWLIPQAESEYRKGIEALDRYLARLGDDARPDAQFYARADNLSIWLGEVETRLGSLSQRLSASVGKRQFYEARGSTYAILHLLEAVDTDFADVLEKKNARVSLRQIIRELEPTQDTVYSPMILNGGGFGVLANHSLVMASHISRANAAMSDLRQLLEQG